MTEGTDEKKILIISGGNVDRDFAALWVKENCFDSCIAVDRGAEAALDIGLKIDLLIGDFDSLDESIFENVKRSVADIISLNPEKDATDTELAIMAARDRGANSIYILGATGERADHTFTSLMNLVQTSKEGVPAFIIDKYNKIYTCDGDICIEREGQHGDYVSLAVISDYADITLSGMKYDLENERVFRGSSLCQSNEIMAERAFVSVKNGTVLIFESKDG